MRGELFLPLWTERAVQRLFVKKQGEWRYVITGCVKVTLFFW